jgi:hypothetical protein
LVYGVPEDLKESLHGAIAALQSECIQPVLTHQFLYRKIEAGVHRKQFVGQHCIPRRGSKTERADSLQIGGNRIGRSSLDTFNELRQAQGMKLQSEGFANQKWLGGEVQKSRRMGADNTDLG